MFEKERGIIPVPLSALAPPEAANRPPMLLNGIDNLIVQKGAMK